MKNCKARIQAKGFLVVWLLMPFAVWAGDVRPAWFEVIEAEGMHLRGDWRVIKGQEGYFPSAPNGWSADRIRGGLDAARPVFSGAGFMVTHRWSASWCPRSPYRAYTRSIQ